MIYLKIIYNEALFRPLFNGLIWFYTILPWRDLGLAIVVFTIVIRIVLTPLLLKARKAQKDMNAIQPEIKKIQEKHKNNREAQSKDLMELYAKHKVNPFSGCLVLLVQLPILIALFQVFRESTGVIKTNTLYHFIMNPGILHPISFGILDLSKGNLSLGVIAAVTQYFQTKLTAQIQPSVSTTANKQDFTQMLQWQTLYIFPVLIIVWSYTLPSALVLYWTILNIFGILQEIILTARSKHGS